jgi:hypothetical protein
MAAVPGGDGGMGVMMAAEAGVPGRRLGCLAHASD